MKKTNLKLTLFLLIICVLIIAYPIISAFELPHFFNFAEEKSLKKWEEKIFKGRTFYKIKVEKTEDYLSAYSKESASGIFYKLKFDPKTKPMVSWKWKVIKFPDKKNVRPIKNGWIEKDDYAARFYVIFPSLFFTKTKTLEYVWDKDIPNDTIKTSPYFKNIKLIVIESGEKKLGKWVYEKRNIYKDYKKAFGEAPGKVGAIAIMTDTDNTASTSETHYDEIKAGYKNE